MKASKLPELFFARLQIVKGRFKARIYGLDGCVPLNVPIDKPLEKGEVRVTKGYDWLDLVSYDLDAMHDYVDKIREKRKQGEFSDIRHFKPVDKPSASQIQKPRREALKRLAAVLKRELR